MLKQFKKIMSSILNLNVKNSLLTSIKEVNFRYDKYMFILPQGFHIIIEGDYFLILAKNIPFK